MTHSICLTLCCMLIKFKNEKKEENSEYKNTNSPAATNCPASDLFFQPKKTVNFCVELEIIFMMNKTNVNISNYMKQFIFFRSFVRLLHIFRL